MLQSFFDVIEIKNIITQILFTGNLIKLFES